MKPKLRAILDQIDTYLVEEKESDARELWEILSALRGPDDTNYADKLYITSVLRAKAFPKTAKESDEIGGVVRASMIKDTREAAKYRRTERNPSTQISLKEGHFIRHAFYAFLTLGLDWGHSNSKEKK